MQSHWARKTNFGTVRSGISSKKQGGPSGEDWAEKVCAEVAELLGLPHAEDELAPWRRLPLDVRGVLSRNFYSRGDTLVLGNELLAEVDPDYAPSVSRFRVIVVDRVNPSPAPAQFRVLCRASMLWPEGFEPFSGAEYEPLVPEAAATADRILLAQGHYDRLDHR